MTTLLSSLNRVWKLPQGSVPNVFGFTLHFSDPPPLAETEVSMTGVAPFPSLLTMSLLVRSLWESKPMQCSTPAAEQRAVKSAFADGDGGGVVEVFETVTDTVGE